MAPSPTASNRDQPERRESTGRTHRANFLWLPWALRTPRRHEPWTAVNSTVERGDSDIRTHPASLGTRRRVCTIGRLLSGSAPRATPRRQRGDQDPVSPRERDWKPCRNARSSLAPITGAIHRYPNAAFARTSSHTNDLRESCSRRLPDSGRGPRRMKRKQPIPYCSGQVFLAS